MAKWKECTISDIGTVVGGATPSTKNSENYEGGTIAWITPKDLSTFRGRYIKSGERNITEKGFKSCSTQLLPVNTVLFSSRAPIGYVAIAEDVVCTNQGFKSVVPNADTDPLFLYYLLKYKKDVIENMGSGTTFKEVSGNTMKNIAVRVPTSKDEQRKIAEIIGSFDDKIELNSEINNNLEEQAQAIFKSWFNDYEPFGGSAPTDWIPTTFGQIAKIKTDTFSPIKNPNFIVEHYSIPSYDERRYPVFEIASGIKSNKYILTSNSVMISKLNPDTKRIWRPMCLSENPVCSTEFIVYEAVNSAHKDFVYSIIDSMPFLNHLCSHTTGSTNSRQRATPKTTLEFPILLPSDEIIGNFCNIVTPIYEMITSNIIENQSLAKTRDALLPRLMSDELDVFNINL
ncbi:MAG: restriction endonuclease subunit S [Roseburia sp.]|nr:restriction endonuclease subunit S [Roseburia sp.]MCM1278246.1 restriction endonuclease subunit S [Robinsoniella sp.]MCM1278251.1 restriction endonuclease subunit S [Robinsoniella sp.]